MRTAPALPHLIAALITVACYASPQAVSQCAPTLPTVEAWFRGDSTTDYVSGYQGTFFTGSLATNWFHFSSGPYPNGFVIQNVDRLLNTTGPFTVELMVRRTSTLSTYRSVITELGTDPGSSTEGQFALRVNGSGTVHFLRHSGVGSTVYRATSAPVVPHLQFAHVVAVYGGSGPGDLAIFMNGTQIGGNGTALQETHTSPVATRIGGGPTSAEAFQGQIKDVLFYRRALSAAEIQLMANNAHCSTCTTTGTDFTSFFDADTFEDGFAVDHGGRGSANIGTVTTTADGAVGDAFEFDGTNHIETARPLVRTTGPFTAEAWIRWDGGPGFQGIISEAGSTNGSREGQFSLSVCQVGGNEVLCFIRHDGNGDQIHRASSPPGTVPIGTWAHVAAVYTGGSDLKAYLNGQLVTSPAVLSSSGALSPNATRIGVIHPGVSPFVGRIDEVGLFRRALSQAELENIYTAGLFGRCKTPPTFGPGGTAEDLEMHDVASDGLAFASPQTTLLGGDHASFSFGSPGGTFVWSAGALAGQTYPSGSPPTPFPVIPGFLLDATQSFILFGTAPVTPVGNPNLIPPQGASVAATVPMGLAGNHVRLQGFAINAALAANGVAITAGIDILFE